MQLQSAISRFEKQGVKLAAISYDSEEILKYFADRHKIEYPLLADPESKTIQAYGVLNAEATGMQKGFARPGYFFIGTDGIIREKFFEAKYRERLTGNSVISKLFPELGQEVTETIEAPHLQLALEQSDPIGVPGTRVTLVAEVRLPPDVHVYAPGTQGYKPIKLEIESIPQLELKPIVYGVRSARRGNSSRSRESWSIRLATRPPAMCPPQFRSNGNCKSSPWIAPERPSTFDTNRAADYEREFLNLGCGDLIDAREGREVEIRTLPRSGCHRRGGCHELHLGRARPERP